MPRRVLGALLVLYLGTLARAQVAERPVHVLYPLTIRGNATDAEGKPVAGAKVFLLSTNRTRPGGFEALLAQTTTDGDGRYAFSDVRVPALPPDGGPIHKHVEGSFQVYAIADGYGFTWHPQQRFRPEAMRAGDEEKDVIHAGEQGVANLTLGPPATVSGRVTSDRGEPLKGVRVQLGFVNDLRRPEGHGAWRCNYLGRPDEGMRAVADEFAGIVHVPKEMRSTVTDADGRFSIGGLRRETSYLALIDYQPECEPLSLGVATTSSKKAESDRPLGYDGELNHVFVTPREIRVHVAAPDDGLSLAGVTIRAARSRLQRAGNLATTDADGRATLRLPPDKYTLFADPPLDAPFLLTSIPLDIAAEDQQREVRLTLEWGATVVVQAKEAGTDEPLAGVEFLKENAEGTEREDLHSQSVILDYPATDKTGTLRAVLAPGAARLVVGKHPPDFDPVRTTSERLELSKGQVHTVAFEFKKKEQPAKAAVAKLPAELEKLRALVQEQQALSTAGTYRIRLFRSRLKDIRPADLRSILEACDYTQIPDIVGLIQKRFPEENLRLVKGTITTDGHKRRSEIDFDARGNLTFTSLQIDNGREVISLLSDNAQASIFNRRTLYVHGPERLLNRPFFPGPQEDGTQPELRVTRDQGKLTLVIEHEKRRYVQVIEEKSGFLIHSSSSRGDGYGNEVWQFAPRKLESGLLVAGLSVDFSIVKDRVSRVFIDQLDEVVLERPSPESFVVAAPPGTNIVDFRGEQGQRPKSAVVSYPVRDVVQRANQIDDAHRSILPVLKIGQPAPPIQAAEWLTSGGKTAAPELGGKVVLIDFWGIGCGPCIGELPEVQALAKELSGKDFVLVGLHNSGHEVAEVADFAKQRGLTYVLAIDQPATGAPSFGATFTAYGIRGIPNCAVLDRAGKVAFIGRFDDAARAAAKLLDTVP